MERRLFIRQCGFTTLGVALTLQSCASVYYASAIRKENQLYIQKSEFWFLKKDQRIEREFVLIKTANVKYPICLYKVTDEEYVASLMMCTHNQCELNAGGGIYSCPCHGSEFSARGEVLEGPAERNLTTFKTEINGDQISIHLV